MSFVTPEPKIFIRPFLNKIFFKAGEISGSYFSMYFASSGSPVSQNGFPILFNVLVIVW